MKNTIIKWAGIAMVFISLACIGYLHHKEVMRIKQYQDLSKQSTIMNPAKTTEKINAIIAANSKQQSDHGSKENNPLSEKDQLESVNKITEQLTYDWNQLLLINNGIKGWLTIPDTLIDFPVVCTDDNEYYLTHNFLKEKDKAGCPFFDKNTQVWDHNRVIYGHNMGTGSKSMFSTLLQYEDQEYLDAHPIIYFTETYGSTTAYEIMAVIKFNISDIETWDFRIREFGSKEIYEAWHEQVQQRSICYKPVTNIHYPAKLLTLSTCDRREWGADGRLLIIGMAL